MTDIFIADISNYQDPVDLPTYRETNAILIEQATWGESITDPNGRLALIRSLKFEIVVWYLGVLAGDSAQGHVDAFMQAIGGQLLPGETVALDWETTNGVMPSAALRDEINTLLASTLTIPVAMAGTYGSPGNLTASPPLGWPWVAAYEEWPEPSVPHVLWQFTNGQYTSGPYGPISFPGIGFCDASVFHGTPEQLAALIVPNVTPQPTPTPVPTPTNKDDDMAASDVVDFDDGFEHQAHTDVTNDEVIHHWRSPGGLDPWKTERLTKNLDGIDGFIGTPLLTTEPVIMTKVLCVVAVNSDGKLYQNTQQAGQPWSGWVEK